MMAIKVPVGVSSRKRKDLELDGEVMQPSRSYHHDHIGELYDKSRRSEASTSPRRHAVEANTATNKIGLEHKPWN